MRFPISYARSRLFSPATLPASVRSFYAVTMPQANALLAAHFPSTGPGANFSVIAFDVEYKGRKHSDNEMRLLPVPLPPAHRTSHFLRLLTIARDGVVIAFDLVALRGVFFYPCTSVNADILQRYPEGSLRSLGTRTSSRSGSS